MLQSGKDGVLKGRSNDSMHCPVALVKLGNLEASRFGHLQAQHVCHCYNADTRMVLKFFLNDPSKRAYEKSCVTILCWHPDDILPCYILGAPIFIFHLLTNTFPSRDLPLHPSITWPYHLTTYLFIYHVILFGCAHDSHWLLPSSMYPRAHA